MTKKATKNPMLYPFTTKGQITERLQSDNDFVVECLQSVGNARTNSLLPASERRGFMVSHARRGNALCEAFTKNQKLSEPEIVEARKLMLSYTKQLARILRRKAIQENPELAKVAEVFSAK